MGGPVRLAGEHSVFPSAPVGGCPCEDVRIVTVHQARIGSDDVAVSLEFGNACPETLPSVGEEAAYAPVEPVDLGAPRCADAIEDDLRDPAGVLLGVSQS